jgi:hypothetical protein
MQQSFSILKLEKYEFSAAEGFRRKFPCNIARRVCQVMIMCCFLGVHQRWWT